MPGIPQDPTRGPHPQCIAGPETGLSRLHRPLAKLQGTPGAPLRRTHRPSIVHTRNWVVSSRSRKSRSFGERKATLKTIVGFRSAKARLHTHTSRTRVLAALRDWAELHVYLSSIRSTKSRPFAERK